MHDAAQLDRIFAALSDSTRRAILARLAQGEASVSELGEPFGLLVVGGPLTEVEAWLAPFREQWESRFDRLESFLAKKTKPGPNKKGKSP